MAFVTLDSQLLIWGGLRSRADDAKDEPEKAKRARTLLRQLERDGHDLLPPTISACELAVVLSDRERGAFLAALSDEYLVKPFDLHAAAIAAKLFAEAKKLPKDQQSRRPVLSADVKIIATARAGGATVFYSNDRRCRTLASTVMEARDLPTHSEELFD